MTEPLLVALHFASLLLVSASGIRFGYRLGHYADELLTRRSLRRVWRRLEKATQP